MLKTRYIKIRVTDLEEDRYFLYAQDEGAQVYLPSVWQYLLFNHHQESYFGTMVQTEKVDGIEGIVLNGWQLSTLFAHEQFNRMIDWDWDEAAQLCLATAHTVHDSIVEKEWMPDFVSWEHNEFRWALPDRVLDEFNPDFWEQENVL